MSEPADLDRRISIVEEKVESHENRIAQHGREIDDLKMSTLRADSEIKHLSGQVAEVKKTIDGIDGKLDGIIQKPGVRWDSMATSVVNAIALAVVAYMLSRIGM